MTNSFDIWKMLAGIAFFLLAMNFMENSLRLLAGRPFKLLLKKQTNNKLKAIGGGAVVTALLQSSSIANLLVLSMVGAGVVKMENALALMLGSNLGTTLTSWMVATLGFSYNIEMLAIPLAGITGIGMAFLNNQSKWFLVLKFIFSLAFLFIALGYIKTGMEGFVKQTDLSFFNEYPVIVFLLLGIVLTTIVQSSSATMALTLSALHSNAITLLVATAIVLGSEIGTTLKLFAAAAGGIATKKRVALGNFIFNVVTAAVMFALLYPVNYFITHTLQIKDNLFALVFFQSFVNVCCVLMFYPFLSQLGKFLMNRYTGTQEESFYISKVPVTDPEMALEALENETKHFISFIIAYSLESFQLKESLNVNHAVHKIFERKTVAEKYSYIKQLHGEMHSFYLKLQNVTAGKQVTERLNQLVIAIRNSMYAAKNIHDAQYDIEQMRNSSNEIKYGFYKQSGTKLLQLYQQVEQLLNLQNTKTAMNDLTKLYQSITEGYSENLHLLYKEKLANRVSEVEITTLINFNRELYTSFKSILFGLKDFLLTAKEAEYFDAQPGFIR
jgi:phosphate:Na+ symporter